MDFSGVLVVLYTEAVERWMVGMVLEKFSLTAYHYTHLQRPLVHVKQPKALVAINS
jgi:hypothetical protein